jgi:eukaryotic-like serine/threonine-protein kinase
MGSLTRPRRRTSAFGRGVVLEGRYRIRSKLGAGGMGEVYAATDVTTGLDVAIKALGVQAFSTENLRRFRREAQTAASVTNRHLCEVHHFGIADGTPFIVMERLRGETLAQRVAEAGPLAASEAVAIMMQLLDGLSAAHDAGILHRDVKPANVFVITPRGAATLIKVIDFGLAKRLPQTGAVASDDETTMITRMNMIAGTPAYLAPEQLAGARDLDPRVDVWAAGATFYEMLVGRPLFEALSYAQLAMSILREPFTLASSLRPDLPAGLDRVLALALAKDRGERFPTAAAFRAGLVAEWARHRTEGVARGERLRKFRGPPKPKPGANEVGAEDVTELDVHVEFEPED